MVAGEQQLARLLKAYLLLILDRAQSSQRDEVAMQAGAAHAGGFAQRLDPQPRITAVADPFNRAADAADRAFWAGDVAQQSPLRACRRR